MHRHAEAEDTGAAVPLVTWAVSVELTAELAWVASAEVLAELASEVLADVIWRAFPEVPFAMRRELAMERGLAMERAFAERAFALERALAMERGLAMERAFAERAFSVERAFYVERAFSVVAFQFYQRLRLRKLRYPTPPPVFLCPRQQLVQSKIRLSEARRHRRVRVQASPWLVAMPSPQKQ
jgi:hypothetical protein